MIREPDCSPPNHVLGAQSADSGTYVPAPVEVTQLQRLTVQALIRASVVSQKLKDLFVYLFVFRARPSLLQSRRDSHLLPTTTAPMKS